MKDKATTGSLYTSLLNNSLHNDLKKQQAGCNYCVTVQERTTATTFSILCSSKSSQQTKLNDIGLVTVHSTNKLTQIIFLLSVILFLQYI